MIITPMINIIKRWQTYIFLLLKIIILLSNLLLPNVLATTLSNIYINNNLYDAKVIFLISRGKPEYRFFLLNHPDRLVIDFCLSDRIFGLPIKFINNNLIKGIRTSQPINSKYQRIIIELANRAVVSTVVEQKNHQYKLVLILKTNQFNVTQPKISQPATKISNKSPSMHSQIKKKKLANPNHSSAFSEYRILPKIIRKIIVVIDAGHGGKDPGAIGQNGHHEKNITMSIARKLEKHLKKDPMFKPIMTRNGDYFISVTDRSEVARHKVADMLVSIHADAAPNNRARGASVWVLSNQRVNSELGNWLEQHEKQSELLGDVGNTLVGSRDPYLSKVVLDLQFGNSQRVSYAVAVKVLRELSKISDIHKYNPEHASLGVLRSPNIPSILVETGFISNIYEERLLISHEYQESIAIAIYKGLRNYFIQNPLQEALK